MKLSDCETLSETEVQQFEIGTHIARWEPPDLFFIRLHGDFLENDLIDHAELYGRAPKAFYVMVDTSEMGSFTSEAKKLIKEVPIADGLIVFGGSAKSQIVLSLLSKVYMMVSRGTTNVKFVANEAEGRNWVERLRQQAKTRK